MVQKQVAVSNHECPKMYGNGHQTYYDTKEHPNITSRTVHRKYFYTSSTSDLPGVNSLFIHDMIQGVMLMVPTVIIAVITLKNNYPILILIHLHAQANKHAYECMQQPNFYNYTFFITYIILYTYTQVM